LLLQLLTTQIIPRRRFHWGYPGRDRTFVASVECGTML